MLTLDLIAAAASTAAFDPDTATRAYLATSGCTRVSRAMAWKARHLADLPAEQRRAVVMTPPAGK